MMMRTGIAFATTISYSLAIFSLLLLSTGREAAVAAGQVPDANNEICAFGNEMVTTQLNFMDATLTENALHENNGGVLRYENIGYVQGRPIDFVVSVTAGTGPYFSATASGRSSKTKKGKQITYTNPNGFPADTSFFDPTRQVPRQGQFGQINIEELSKDGYRDPKNKKPSPADGGPLVKDVGHGHATFDFCLYDNEKKDQLVSASFRFTMVNIDQRPSGMKQQIRMDATQLEDYVLYTNAEESEIKVSCEGDGSDVEVGAPSASLPCGPGLETIFHSTTLAHWDTMTSPHELTEAQMKQSVVFSFKETACFTMTLYHYCPSDNCKYYGGGNFQFAGEAEQVIKEGECSHKIPAPSPTNAPTEEGALCYGKTHTETNLDFDHATIGENTLHEGQASSKLVYNDVGIVRDRPVKLVVTVVEGTEYTTSKPYMNGKDIGQQGMFGHINLMTTQNNPRSGEGNFEFCFHDQATNEKVVVDSFRWSVFDLDERNAAYDGIKEKLIMDLRQVQDYVLWPTTQQSEIKLSCESGGLDSHLPCNSDDRVVFHSSTHGKGADNPRDKDDMTDQQKERSVQFTFVNKSCFTFTYNHYCPPDLDDPQNSKGCMWYGGGNFLFSGEAKQLIEEGQCIPLPSSTPTTKPPTFNPTPPTISLMFTYCIRNFIRVQ